MSLRSKSVATSFREKSGATIIRRFERGAWEVTIVSSEATMWPYSWPYFRLACAISYEHEAAAVFTSPWVPDSELVGPIAKAGGFCASDPIIASSLMKGYGRATVGGAVLQARRWQIEAVKQRLRGRDETSY